MMPGHRLARWVFIIIAVVIVLSLLFSLTPLQPAPAPGAT